MVSASGPVGILAGRQPILSKDDLPPSLRIVSGKTTTTTTSSSSTGVTTSSSTSTKNGSCGPRDPEQPKNGILIPRRKIVNPEDEERHRSNLYVRPSWTNAAVAVDQMKKGKVDGQMTAVIVRSYLQRKLSGLGKSLHKHSGKILFVAIIVLSVFCVALKSAKVHSRIDQLWIEEGGRLAKEMAYVEEKIGESLVQTHQLIIQTPKTKGANILQVEALKEHLEVLSKAAQIKVYASEAVWGVKDLCITTAMPQFEAAYIDRILEKLNPCNILTPLSCFWEGSKMLGLDNEWTHTTEGQKVSWTSMDPVKLVADMKAMNYSFPFQVLENFMKDAGIGHGYVTKPCLDPSSPLCPSTAANKNSTKPVDVGAILAGGCYGFAAKYMHWPVDLIVGGAQRNKSGYLTKASSFQTVIQLMTPQETYEFWKNHDKVSQHIDWTPEKAAWILERWQLEFTRELNRLQNNTQRSHNYYAFSTDNLNDIIKTYSHFSPTLLAICAGTMILYVGLVLNRWKDRVRSQAGVGMAGVILVCVTLATSLGLCSLMTIPFNAISMHILPFISLGFGVRDIFLLTHAYADLSFKEVPVYEQTSAVLMRNGLSVIITNICSSACFFSAALIPIPALRVFCIQAGVLQLVNLAVMVLIFPALINLDVFRRKSERSDIFCCCMPKTTSYKPASKLKQNNKKQRQTLIEEGGNEEESLTGSKPNQPTNFSLSQLVAKYYAPTLTRPATKAVAMVLLALILGGSTWQTMQIPEGLNLVDLVPQYSHEHAFLTSQADFGFYNMYAVTGADFDYPNNQKLLFDYHDAFVRVKNVVKSDTGGLPPFWLGLFRNWLRKLQAAFDDDLVNNRLNFEGWRRNASENGILAFKLLAQTGNIDNPVDKSLIRKNRLVDGEGMINARAFYNYLSAWAAHDDIAYMSAQANFRPVPKTWYAATEPQELKIPKSQPLTYAQIPFNLYKLRDTKEMTEFITTVRSICKKFEDKGLPNFPSGIPFMFWEQYTNLRYFTLLALAVAIAATAFLSLMLLLNLWAALLISTTVAGNLLQFLGTMGLFGVRMSAITSVLLVISIGISVHFCIHICLSYITCVGGRDRRARLALEHMIEPIFHSAVAAVLAISLLAFSEFGFIVNYFFIGFLSSIVIGIINGLFFFPILLSLVGPAAEVVPVEYPDRISTPTPPTSPNARKSSKKVLAPSKRSHKSDNSKRVHDDQPSLTTISEEPSSWHSQQESCIIGQKTEVKVETYANQNGNGSETSISSFSTQPMASSSHYHTTKVEVTTKFELLPQTRGSEGSEKYKQSSRRSSRCSSTTLINTMESSGSSSEHDSDSNTNSKR